MRINIAAPLVVVLGGTVGHIVGSVAWGLVVGLTIVLIGTVAQLEAVIASRDGWRKIAKSRG